MKHLFETAAATGMCVLVLMALAAGIVIAPGLQGQEPGDTLDSTAVADRQFSVLLGMRREPPYSWNFKKYPPGGSLQMTWLPPNTSLWLSLQFFRQIDRRNSSAGVHIDFVDHGYVGRVMAGFGRGDGPSVFAFYQKGRAVIKEDPEPSEIGNTYTHSAFGWGLGYTSWRLTARYDSYFGAHNRGEPDLHGGSGVSLHYRVF